MGVRWPAMIPILRGIAIRKSMSWSNSQVRCRVSGVFGFSDSILFLWTTSGGGGKQLGGELWNRCLGCVDIVFLLPLQEDSCHESWWSFCRFETYFSGIFVGKIDDSCSSASTQKFGGPVKVVELDHWNSPKAPPKPAQRSCKTKSSDFLPGWFRASAFFSVPRIGYHRAPQKRDSSLQLPGCWINNSPHCFSEALCFSWSINRTPPKKAPLDLGGGFNQFLFSLFDWGDDETCFFCF